MPYIKQEARKQYTERLDDLCFALDEHGWVPGEVTYVLYMIVARWFRKMPSYITIAQIRGVLIGTMTEFDRRMGAPYEDEKIKENGDVEIECQSMEGGEWEAGGVPHPDCEVCTSDRPADKTLEAPALVNRDKGCEHYSRYCEVCSNMANQQRR